MSLEAQNLAHRKHSMKADQLDEGLTWEISHVMANVCLCIINP